MFTIITWKVTIVDTGINTMTGGRVKRIQQYVKNETFMLTYGDGLANINIDELLETHRKAGKIVTISAVKIRQRFGVLHIEENGEVSSFREKLDADEERVNGGFMVMEPQVFKYIDGDDTVLERDILGRLAEEKEIKAYKHDGFWQPMDTIREREKLEELWGEDGTGAPWKIWDDK